MRINVSAAIGLGLLLPILETVRRGFDHWLVSFTTMFEDYLAGAALLVAAIASIRGKRWAPLSLVVVWSGTMFMMLISTVSQIERQIKEDLEAHSENVLIIKIALFALSLGALVQSLLDAYADAITRAQADARSSALE